MALEYRKIPVTHYQQNCSIVWCSNTKKAAVIDPGGDVAAIVAAVERLGVQLEKILLTHGHLDHVGGTASLVKLMSLPVIGPHQDDAFWIDALESQANTMGFSHAERFQPNQWLVHGDTVRVGEEELDVIHCPGHTPGHVVFYSKGTRLAFVGDVLFNGSVGRTDFPRGSATQLVDSIVSRLWPLGEDVRFVPGHGPESTFGQERKTNPFVGDSRFE